MYILQQTLFFFEQWLEIETGDRLPLFFQALDLRPYAQELRSRSPQGAKGYCREAILRALLAAPLEGISELAEKLFRELVTQCRHEGVIQCHHIAIDSTAIEAYEKKQPISRCQNTDHASWGAKYDPFGNKITWFGYKIHLAVDKVNSPLLTACRDDSLWDATVSGHRV